MLTTRLLVDDPSTVSLRELFQCHLCGVAFTNISSLVTHQAHSHQPKYSCKLCTYQTNALSSFSVHTLVHEPENPTKNLQEFLQPSVDKNCLTPVQSSSTPHGVNRSSVVGVKGVEAVKIDIEDETVTVAELLAKLRHENKDVTSTPMTVLQNVIQANSAGVEVDESVDEPDNHPGSSVEQILKKNISFLNIGPSCSLTNGHIKTERESSGQISNGHHEALTEDQSADRIRSLISAGAIPSAASTLGVGLSKNYAVRNNRRIEPRTNGVGGKEGVNAALNEDVFKMYKCRYCKKKFDRAFSCNRHERIHTGYKPCFCEYCGRGFSEPRNLRHHVIRFHSDGSMKHLIKRDRRKKTNDIPTPPITIASSVVNSATLGNLLQLQQQAAVESQGQSLETLLAQQSTPSSISCSIGNILFPNNKFSSAVLANPTFPLVQSIPLLNGSEEPAIEDSSTGTAADNGHGSPEEVPIEADTKPSSTNGCSPPPRNGLELLLATAAKHAAEASSNGDSSSVPNLTTDQKERVQIKEEVEQLDAAVISNGVSGGTVGFRCQHCSKYLLSLSELSKHVEQCHSGAGSFRPYSCSVCGYAARTSSQLKVHTLRHKGKCT